MALQAGKLRHRVGLESRVESQDETGDIIITWIPEATVWAAFEPLSVKEFIESGSKQSQIVARVTIRYRDDVNATWRLIYRDAIYNIEGVLGDKDSGLEYLTLPVSGGVSIDGT